MNKKLLLLITLLVLSTGCRAHATQQTIPTSPNTPTCTTDITCGDY